MTTRAGDKIVRGIVSFGGLGLMPFAPGTWGTLGACAIHALVVATVGTNNAPFLLPALAVLSIIACITLSPRAERLFGKKDPAQVVIDEVAGYLLAVSFFPMKDQLVVGPIAFLAFRVFEVFKPFPAGRSQQLPRGWGIVADDLIAGLYAAAVVAVALYYLM